MFDEIAKRALDGVSDEDVRKANLSSKLIAAGIAVDKAMILRNQGPSVINVQVLMNIASMIRGDLPNQPQSPPLLSPPKNEK